MHHDVPIVNFGPALKKKESNQALGRSGFLALSDIILENQKLSLRKTEGFDYSWSFADKILFAKRLCSLSLGGFALESKNSSSGTIHLEIEHLLTQAYVPTQLLIENESDLHSGPKGRESHFKVLIVSDHFKGLKRIDRQKHIFETLKDVMPRIHALSLRVLTPDQLQDSGEFQSPDCSHKK